MLPIADDEDGMFEAASESSANDFDEADTIAATGLLQESAIAISQKSSIPRPTNAAGEPEMRFVLSNPEAPTPLDGGMLACEQPQSLGDKWEDFYHNAGLTFRRMESDGVSQETLTPRLQKRKSREVELESELENQ